MADCVVRVSAKAGHGKYIYEAKDMLKKHGKVDFHAVGRSIVIALKASDMLNEFGYTSLESIRTESFQDERDGETRSVAKLVISLRRTDQFDTLEEEFQKSRSTKK